MKKGYILAVLAAVSLSAFSMAASVVPNIAKYSSAAEDTVFLDVRESAFSMLSKALLRPETEEAAPEEEGPKLYVTIQNAYFKTNSVEDTVYVEEILLTEDILPIEIVKSNKEEETEAEKEIARMLLGFSAEKGKETILSADELTQAKIAELVKEEKLIPDENNDMRLAVHLYANWSDDPSEEEPEEPSETPEPQESPTPEGETAEDDEEAAEEDTPEEGESPAAGEDGEIPSETENPPEDAALPEPTDTETAPETGATANE